MSRTPAYLAAMIYLPSRCRSCGKVVLVAAGELQHGCASCLSCGGDLALLVGCAYPEGDITLFAELSRFVHECNVYGIEARRLAFTLEHGIDAANDDSLEWLAARIPALRPTLRMLETYRDRRQQVVKMAITILHARAESHSVDRAAHALVAGDALSALDDTQRSTSASPCGR
jgi:hypothetical protein